MAENKITAGLIGAGRIGKMHAENITAHIPDVFLKAVADPKLDESWAEKRGIPVRSLDMQVVLDDPEIEAVVIATPSTTHVALVCAAARAGKQIFCEKPIAFEPEAVNEAISAVESAGIRFQVGFNRRFDPDFATLKEAVAAGKIGTPHIIRITNRDPVRPDPAFLPDSGGLFMDFSIHDFDTLRFMSGDEVEEIYAAGTVLIDPEIERIGDIDTALITLKLTSGALCIIDNSRETNYGYDQQVEVFGSKGSISARNTTPTNTVLSTTDGVFTDRPYPSFIERYKAAFVAELRSFFTSVRDRTPTLVSGQDALAAVRIARAAQRSCEQNRPVRVVA
ncbi:MAG: inositol 2-dehydrogenase [Fidelibacterota bacterium]|nr:MAG: inositol 2-dehydrogenase [Candidatus Neomarinimicrobiota bacterium]